MRLTWLVGVAAAVVGCVANTPGAAQDENERFSSEYQRCITYGERTGRIAIPAQECAAQELQRQDALLNAAYRTKMASLTAERRTALRQEERAWIVSRDRTCHAGFGIIDRTECLVEATIKRTALIRRFR